MTKKFILGEQYSFKNSKANNTSNNDRGVFVFLDQEKKFSNINDPFISCSNCSTTNEYQEAFSKTLNNVDCNTQGASFYGLKLGDVNFDWDTQISNLAPVKISYDNLQIGNVGINNTFMVPLRVANFNKLLGMQFTLSYNPDNLTFVGLNSNLNATSIEESNMETTIESNTISGANGDDYEALIPFDYSRDSANGNIHFMWTAKNVDPVNITDNSIIGYLKFIKKAYVQKQDIVLTSNGTPIEVIDVDMNLVAMTKPTCSIEDNHAGAVAISADTWDIVPVSTEKGNLLLKINSVNNKHIKVTVTNRGGEIIFSTPKTLVQGDNYIYANLRTIASIPQGIYNVTLEGLSDGRAEVMIAVNEQGQPLEQGETMAFEINNTVQTKSLFVGSLPTYDLPLNIALGNLSVVSPDPVLALYALQIQLYNDLSFDPELLNSDGSFISFKQTAEEDNNIYRIFQIDRLLTSGELNDASSLIQSMPINNAIDENYNKYFNWIYLLLTNPSSSNLISTSDVNDIAIQCPLVGGMVVLGTRDLYNNLVSDNISFQNTCPATVGLKTALPTKPTIPTKPAKFSKNNSTNLLEINNNARVKIYPNPSLGSMTIQLPVEANTVWNVALTDMYGKQLYTKQTSDKQLNIAIKASNGTYLLVATNIATGKKEVSKVVIAH